MESLKSRLGYRFASVGKFANTNVRFATLAMTEGSAMTKWWNAKYARLWIATIPQAESRNDGRVTFCHCEE